MNRRIALLAGGIFVLAMPPPVLQAQFAHPDLTGGKKVIHTVLVLPAQASLVKSGMKGNEPLVEESQALASNLLSIVGETLAGKGCNVVRDAFAPATVDQNPDLKYALADLQTRYDKLEPLINKKPKDVRSGRFTLGDEVANFSPGASADALVFVRAYGVVTTGGKKAFAAITGVGGGSNYVALDISVVDAQTGAVLYFARPGAGGNFVGNPEGMKKAINKSFSDFGSPKQGKK